MTKPPKESDSVRKKKVVTMTLCHKADSVPVARAPCVLRVGHRLMRRLRA